MDYDGEITRPIIAWVPDILRAVLVILVGYVLARIIKEAVIRGLKSLDIDRKIFNQSWGKSIRKIMRSPTRLIGGIVYWLVIIITLTIAIPILHIPYLNNLMSDFYGYIPNIVSSILILVVAIVISNAIAGFVKRIAGETVMGRIVGTIAPSLIMAIAVFMILVQLKIAVPIVIITYASLLGALALAFALAFGLGGRDLASKILNESYENNRRKMEEQKKPDLGRERIKDETEGLEEDLEDEI